MLLLEFGILSDELFELRVELLLAVLQVTVLAVEMLNLSFLLLLFLVDNHANSQRFTHLELGVLFLEWWLLLFLVMVPVLLVPITVSLHALYLQRIRNGVKVLLILSFSLVDLHVGYDCFHILQLIDCNSVQPSNFGVTADGVNSLDICAHRVEILDLSWRFFH